MYLIDMRRWIVAVAFFGLVLAACGGATVQSTFDTVPTSPTTAAPSTTEAADPGDSTTSTTDPPETTTTTSAPVVVDGPPAPDFTLVLGDGEGEFVLSAEQKPVYMVFWAEW